MTIIIRKAKLKDFEKLKKIKKEFYQYECTKDKLLNSEWVNRPLASFLGKTLRNKNFVYFLAEESGKIIGYAASQIEKCPAFFKIRKRGHIFNLYVKPKYRNKNIGKRLLKNAIKWFKNNKIDLLWGYVYSYNKKGLKFYKRENISDYMIIMNKILK